MLLHNNIDKNDAAYNTKAPFMGHCELRLGNDVLSAGSILAAKFYVPEDLVPPIRLYQVTAQELTFTDYNGTYFGSIAIGVQTPDNAYFAYQGFNSDYPYMSGFITNKHNVIVGHITIKPDAIYALVAAAKRCGGTFTAGVDDFLFLPQTHAASFNGGVRAFSINAYKTTNNVNLSFASQNINFFYSTANKYMRVHVLKGITQEGKQQGVYELIVNDKSFDVKGKHIQFRATELSNVRVTVQDGAVVMKGVSDE